MENLDELKKSLLADGKIDKEEVEQLRKVLYADGVIDAEEVPSSSSSTTLFLVRTMLLNGRSSLLKQYLTIFLQMAKSTKKK